MTWVGNLKDWLLAEGGLEVLERLSAFLSPLQKLSLSLAEVFHKAGLFMWQSRE